MASIYPLRLRAWPWLLIVATALTAAGCSWFGGGGAAPRPDQMTVVLEDYRFDPETIRVRRGQEVTLTLRNDGAVVHNFRIDEFSVDQDVDVGEDETITFTPDKAGTFEIVCDIPGHRELGMVGRLEVTQ